MYVEGNSDSPLTLQGIELDGNWIDSGIWFTSRSLAKGDKQLAVIDLDRPLKRGNWLTVKVVCQGGVATEERVRIFTGFPINVEDGAPAPGFGLDAAPYTCRPEYLTKPDAAPAPRDANALAVNHIFDCAIHTYAADHARSAGEILRRYDLSVTREPRIPCSQHLCRVRPETFG